MDDNNESRYSPFEKAIGLIVIIVAIITILISIVLIIPTCKVKNSYPNLIFLLTQLLISSIVCASYFILNEIQRRSRKLPCILILIVRNFCSLTVISSSICICISNLLLIKGSLILKTKPVLLKVFFLIGTWFIPLLFLIIFLVIKEQMGLDFENLYDCTMSNPSGENANNGKLFDKLYFSVSIIYYLVAFVICILVIERLCKIQKEIPNQSSQKLIKVVVSYIVGIFFFFVFDIALEILRPFIKNTKIRTIGLFFLCFMNLVLVYLFVWNKQVRNNCCKIFCNKSEFEIINKKEEEFEEKNLDLMSE